MKLTSAIEALTRGNQGLSETIRRLDMQERGIREKRMTAQREWQARGELLDAMKKVQETFPKDETIDFVVPGEYE